MRREKEVRDFFKEREQADRIIQEVKDQVEGRGISAEEVVDALMEHEPFWEKMRECLKGKRRK